MKREKERNRRHLFAGSTDDWVRRLERDPSEKEAALMSWLPPGKDRRWWDSLDPELRDLAVKKAEELLPRSFPQILLSEYREFCTNGNRSHYEEKYFARRRMLTTLVLAECAAHKGTYLDKIADGIYLILEETTWCLPAHNSYIRDTPQLPVPDEARPVIDLFAAETAAILSLAEYVLRDELDSLSPFIGQYISREIRRRILVPYLNYHFWWMGDGIQPMLNWTPWITQNILLAVFFRRSPFLSLREAAEVIRQASASLDYFLDEYAEDGCCDEGAQYFGHAGLCLFGSLEVICHLTGDQASRLFLHPLIRNMASYIVKIYAGNGYYFNFADCSAHPGHRTARDFLFGVRTENKALAAFASKDYRSQSMEERLQPQEENLFYHLLQFKYHQEMLLYPTDEIRQADSWFESTQILTARDDVFSLAVRGGSNGDSHNHNDTGSLILYKNGKPLLIDLGVETYTKKTFSDQRYEIWTMQSAYHNLPTFFDGEAPVMQKAGAEYGADCVLHEISQGRCRLSAELAPAYADDRIRSYRRNVSLVKGEGVFMEDTYDGDLPCRLSLMVYEEPLVTEEDGRYRIVVKDTGELLVEGASYVFVETLPIADPRLREVWKHECYRLLLSFAGNIKVSSYTMPLPCSAHPGQAPADVLLSGQ